MRLTLKSDRLLLLDFISQYTCFDAVTYSEPLPTMPLIVFFVGPCHCATLSLQDVLQTNGFHAAKAANKSCTATARMTVLGYKRNKQHDVLFSLCEHF